MAGTKNDVLVGKNADFTQAGAPNSQTSEANGLATNGQLWIGSTATNPGGTHINVGTLTSPAGTITIGYNSPNITLDLAGGSVAVDSVQVDAFTAPGTNPVAPTGGGLLTITGNQVAAGTVGANVIRTDSLAANTLTVEIQRSAAVVASAAQNNGVSHFNSAEFTVDANGFVSLAGGGLAVDSFAMQTGTSPVVPSGTGLVTFSGATVAAGTNPVRTDGTGANTMTLEVQISQALAATDATKIGLCNFDSAAFDVDANGFVQLNGGGIAVTSIDVDAHTAPGTDPVVPTAAGQIAITGAQVAAGTVGANVIRTDSLAANSLTVEIQRTTAVASTTSANNGVAHFNSAQFSVDANGFVTSNGSGFIWIDQATSTTVAVNRGYFVTAATTQTLPAAPAQGDVVKIVVADAVTVVVAANAGQTLTIGAVSSAVTATSTASGSTLEFVYRAATTTWFSISTTGTWITT